MRLLTSNEKLNKSDDRYTSLGLQLYPYKILLDNNKIKNSCAYAEKYNCFKSCVAFSGHGIYSNVKSARLERTKLFYQDFKQFKILLESELIKENIKAKKTGKVLTVRLNTYSDLNIIKFFGDLIEKYQDIIFYDYTKLVNYIYDLKKYHDKGLLKNYNIVYSYNIDDLNNKELLKNILDITSIVLVLPLSDKNKNKDFTSFIKDKSRFLNYPIVNGDLQDIRQEKNSIICLSFKSGKQSLINEISNNNKIILPIKYLSDFS